MFELILLMLHMAAVPSAAPVSPPPPCVPPAISSLPGPPARHEIHFVPQDCHFWCWAASGQMIMHYFGKDVSQCQQASAVSPSPCCDASGNAVCSTDCDESGWPLLEDYGFTYDVAVGKALSQATIRQQIGCLRKPIAHAYRYIAGWDFGHMVVVYGYYTDTAGVFWLETYNPEIGVETIPYSTYKTGPFASSVPWRDYYNFVRVK